MKSSHIKQTNKERNSLLITLLVFLIISYPLIGIGIRYYILALILSFYTLFIIIVKKIKLEINKTNIKYILVAIVTLIFFLLPIANNTSAYSFNIIENFLMCSLFTTIIYIDGNIYNKFINIVLIASLLISVYIIICKFYPNFYFSYIFPYLNGIDKTFIYTLMINGYGVPIGGNVVYADYLLTMASIIAYSNITMKKNVKINMMLIIVYFVGILLEQRRSEFICYLCMFIIISFINRKNKINISRIIAIITIVLICVFIINRINSLGYLLRFTETIKILFGDTTINTNELTSNRLLLWGNALREFKKSPIFGIGWGMFQTINTNGNLNTHNLFIQLLCETGLIGFILILVPLFSLYFESYKLLKKTQIINCDCSIKSMINLSFGMQTYFWMLNFMDPTFYKNMYCIIMCFCVVFVNYCKEYLRNFNNEKINVEN